MTSTLSSSARTIAEPDVPSSTHVTVPKSDERPLVSFSSPPPTIPPPPPAPTDASSRTTKLLALLTIVGLAVAALMTVLWIGGRGDTGDAIAERDLAIAERDDASATATASAFDFGASQESLATTEAELANARAELDAIPPDAPTAADVDALESEIADLATSNSALTDQNATLVADLDTAREAATPPNVVEEPSSPEVDAPAFDRWIGELLSSRSGTSRLGEAASTCFGAQVIDLIGLDAIGAGQNNVARNADRDVVVQAMQAAAANCNIDPGLIFG